MTVPDLDDTAGAGVRPWPGNADAVKTAAAAAKFRFFAADLDAVASKQALLAALAAGLKLPAHFGMNWDALADCLEDEDWLGARGAVVVLRHAGKYRKAHAADWEMVAEILGEAADYWRERHKPFWVFVG
jgi:RNAse (barnase) inhibitor barstar